MVGESGPVVDDKYGALDTLTFTFSHDSDLARMTANTIISQATLLTLFGFDVSLGVFFYGKWLGPRELKVCSKSEYICMYITLLTLLDFNVLLGVSLMGIVSVRLNQGVCRQSECLVWVGFG